MMASSSPYCSLCVADLSKYCSDEELGQLFLPFGPIASAKIVQRNDYFATGLVTLTSYEAAEVAKGRLDGCLFMGNRIRVSWSNTAVPQAPPISNQTINSIYIRYSARKLERLIRVEDLQRMFAPFGLMTEVCIKDSHMDHRTGRQSGLAFVHFASCKEGMHSAFRAVSAMDGSTVEGVAFRAELSRNLLRQFDANKGATPPVTPPMDFRDLPMPSAPAYAAGMPLAYSSHQYDQRPQPYPQAMQTSGLGYDGMNGMGGGMGALRPAPLAMPVYQEGFRRTPASAPSAMQRGGHGYGYHNQPQVPMQQAQGYVPSAAYSPYRIPSAPMGPMPPNMPATMSATRRYYDSEPMAQRTSPFVYNGPTKCTEDLLQSAALLPHPFPTAYAAAPALSLPSSTPLSMPSMTLPPPGLTVAVAVEDCTSTLSSRTTSVDYGSKASSPADRQGTAMPSGLDVLGLLSNSDDTVTTMGQSKEPPRSELGNMDKTFSWEECATTTRGEEDIIDSLNELTFF